MQTKELKVRCEYLGEDDIENIILRSFRLYADNFLRQDIKRGIMNRMNGRLFQEVKYVHGNK